jgi:hypothetical protein
LIECNYVAIKLGWQNMLATASNAHRDCSLVGRVPSIFGKGKFASHKKGGKLCFRFSLEDLNQNEVSSFGDKALPGLLVLVILLLPQHCISDNCTYTSISFLLFQGWPSVAQS